MLCAIYCRLSKEDEEKGCESESIQNQKSMLLKYALEQSWEVYGLYCDEDFSGIDRRRPDFNRLLADAEAGRFQVVLCKTQSRFTRDMELVEKYLHGLFPAWGIRFIAVVDNADTDVKGNKKARQINGLVNEWYLEDLSENIRMVLDHKRRQGQYIGGFPIYGYRKDPLDKNRLVVDPEAAGVVRRIFALCLEGLGKGAIAGCLNGEGVPNPTRYKGEQGLTYVNGGAPAPSGLWSRATVGKILHNEMYAGVMVQGRRRKLSYKSKTLVDVPREDWFRVEGTHEAIIEPERFRQAQALMEPRAKTDGRGQVHPLAGLVRCMSCGAAMSKTSNGQTGADGKPRSYLRCRQCEGHAVRLDRLLAAVTERLRGQIETHYVLEDVSLLATEGPRRGETEQELRALDYQLARRDTALKRLYLDRAAGTLSEEEFLSLRLGLREERARLARRREELSALSVPAPVGPEALSARAETLLRPEDAPRALLLLTVERVEVGRQDREYGWQEVRIFWKF